MKPEIKTAWVEALRSGQYKQTSGALRNDGSFCCLGVLCDLHSKMTGTAWRGEGYFDRIGSLPFDVEMWAGIEHTGTDPHVYFEGECTNITYLNDGVGLTFPEIANLIEEQL